MMGGNHLYIFSPGKYKGDRGMIRQALGQREVGPLGLGARGREREVCPIREEGNRSRRKSSGTGETCASRAKRLPRAPGFWCY